MIESVKRVSCFVMLSLKTYFVMLSMRILLLSSLWTLIPSICANALSLPLSTQGRWFVDAKGERFTYFGVNWPGHMEIMIPEGLQYQSVSEIVNKIRNLGMNSIRLTYATEMVDDIVKNNRGLTVREGIMKTFGERDGSVLFNKIMAKNSFIKASTTRLEVFDAVASECAKADIAIHLDNHISKAKWCCSTGDGNSWPGDKEFSAESWKRGWIYMANYTLKWANLASFGLRNELRSPDDSKLKPSYNWPTWHSHMLNITQTIHATNPKAVIFLSGLGFDTDLSPIPTSRDMGNGLKFKSSTWPKNKTALELHRYDKKEKDCNAFKQALRASGWNAMDEHDPSIVNQFPVVMTEFGFAQDAKTYKGVYAQCLKDFFAGSQAGWMYWVLAGSYYRRQGKADSDEQWGIMNHDWSDWRSPEVVQNYFLPMAKVNKSS